MAQQLQNRGESVTFLGIIDTRIYSTRFATFWHGSRVFVTSMLPHLGPYISDYLYLQSGLSNSKQAEGQSSRFLSKLMALFQTTEPGGETRRPNFKTPEFKRLLQVFHANVQADSLYRPQRYSGRVTLFKTDNAHPDSTWGWGDIAADGVALHQIPGHHMNVLRPPQVQVLAEKLVDCLAQPDEVTTPYPPR
jgi:thioesterase domain-containing protein